MRKNQNITGVILLLAAVLLAGGCTRMDGDIGDLFGRWNLVSLSADGVDQQLYGLGGGDKEVLLYTWAFQGDLVWILTMYPHQSSHSAKGMWSRTDTQLSLNYSFTDDESPLDYMPPAALHLVDDGVTTLNIETMTSSTMTLWYVSDDDVKYEYHLKKAY